MGREPTIVTEDVKAILQQAIRPGDPDEGEAVAMLADRAHTSTRTVYRCLNPPEGRNGLPHTISLALADRLVMAAGRMLEEIDCRVVCDGQVLPYSHA
jgi:hypothetical protein